MLPARKLREKLSRREVVTGILATDHVWPDLVEICLRAGLDYLIVDMEHGAAGPELVGAVCTTGRRLNFPVFIRPRSNDYAALRLAIDLGPCGFLLACVESARDLDVVRDAVYVPPRGRRRPGGLGNGWVPDYFASTWKDVVEANFIVLPQIETRAGLAAAEEIARHELTTALAVGPYDLSAELGCTGEMNHPRLREALATLLHTTQQAGKPGWMIGSQVDQLVRDGWNFVCVGEPSWVLAAALKAKVEQARQAHQAPA